MKYKIFLVIFFIGLICSLILTSNSESGLCKPAAGCDLVNNSSYGSTLGIKNSVYGIFIFPFLILLTIFHILNPGKHTRRILHLGIILGSLVAIYFLYLQFFVLKLYCKFCIVIDIALLIGLFFMFWLWEH